MNQLHDVAQAMIKHATVLGVGHQRVRLESGGLESGWGQTSNHIEEGDSLDFVAPSLVLSPSWKAITTINTPIPRGATTLSRWHTLSTTF